MRQNIFLGVSCTPCNFLIGTKHKECDSNVTCFSRYQGGGKITILDLMVIKSQEITRLITSHPEGHNCLNKTSWKSIQ